MKKKILLISPTLEQNVKVKSATWLPGLALNIIAAITPKEFDVEIIDEEAEIIDYDAECDIVGLSFMTSKAPRAYEIAKEFKKRGKTVVFGGIHASLLPDEVLQHGDAVVIGEGESAWEKLLSDYTNNNLQRKYQIKTTDLSKYPLPRRELTKIKGLFDVKPILTTRGCPYTCNWCCVPVFFGREIRHIPVSKVVDDIVTSKGKNFLFLDDNIIGYPKYAKELFIAIAPLNTRWVGQASISFVKDLELMKLAKDSGCKGLFFGLENVSKNLPKGIRKNIKEMSKLEDAIKKVKDLGIHFHASLIFGYDDDTEAVFDETLEFLMRNKIGTVTFNILTPYPGTKIFEQYKEENRLLTENWKYYDQWTVVYKPKNMSPMALAEGYLKVRKEFLSIGSIAKRFMGNLSHPFMYTAINIDNRSNIKKDLIKLPNRMNTILNESLTEKIEKELYCVVN
ncbi:MAG: B12-binding domain-containing radical SAM protein [Spirochaetota bacterium]|nr:B12-binding domain-containing radical SAM protein [Spirochaetota bacterium]